MAIGHMGVDADTRRPFEVVNDRLTALGTKSAELGQELQKIHLTLHQPGDRVVTDGEVAALWARFAKTVEQVPAIEKEIGAVAELINDLSSQGELTPEQKPGLEKTIRIAAELFNHKISQMMGPVLSKFVDLNNRFPNEAPIDFNSSKKSKITWTAAPVLTRIWHAVPKYAILPGLGLLAADHMADSNPYLAPGLILTGATVAVIAHTEHVVTQEFKTAVYNNIDATAKAVSKATSYFMKYGVPTVSVASLCALTALAVRAYYRVEPD
jgi:hypothetical protein